jgi:hypothetical protein
MAATGAAIVGAIIGVFTGTVTVVAALTHVLIASALGAALNALTPKPNVTGSGGYSFTGTSGASLDHQIVYGRAKVGSIRIYDATTSSVYNLDTRVLTTGAANEYLHRVIAYAGHEIESFDEIYLNEDLVILNPQGYVTSPAKYAGGYVQIRKHLGEVNQPADPALVANVNSLPVENRWTSIHFLKNIAYLYVVFRYNADKFPNGVPSVSAVIKGKKVYNPKRPNDPPAWSDNPALCLRDYMSSGYGLSIPDARIDDESVKVAQDICDQTVALDNEKRYTCNGVFITGNPPKQIISDLITSMGGLFWYSQGKWRMKAAAYTTPTVTLTEDDLRSGISLSTKVSRRDNFNTVTGLYRSAATDWQATDYATVSSPTYIEADNGLVNSVDYSFPFTTSHKTTQRLAKLFLNRNREQLTVSASFGLKAFQLEVGDFVYVNNARFGWVDKVFEVTSWDFGLSEGLDLQTNLVLREISAAVFDNNTASTDFEKKNTILPDPYIVPAIGIKDRTSELRAGFENIFNVVKATIDSSEASNVERVEVQIQPSIQTLSIVSSGTTQTMTFATQSSAPFITGDIISLGGAKPTDLNGVFTVVTCTTNTVVITRDTSFIGVAVEKTDQGGIGGSATKYWTLVGMGDLGVYETAGLSDGFYSIRARAYNYFGIKGNWVQPDPFLLVGQAAPPENVTNFSYNLSGNNINLQWTPVGDADLSHYLIRHTDDESGSPIWSDATTYVEKIARPASSVSIPAKAGTYMIRAYDKLAVSSPSFAFVVVPTGSLDTFTNNNIISE